ncbi:MAG: transcriptional repressor [Bacteroidetes bacterium 4484_276]|nr:MAG: transcriptional repressor [Bacteroidetes bacterium 4484_276]OYT12139.1 MAG: transcriptional repressor [Bacteroidetes bacterium 4572_114]
MEVNNIIDHLTQHGVKPSPQRLNIYKYLIEEKNHPTVDTIFKDLIGAMPTLSKTTVYNTLKLFIDKGVAKVINIENNETRYDADTSIHGHFKCEKCLKVFDINIDMSEIKTLDISGFLIKETHFYLKGICKKCRSD